mgnify:CR=1 FL=1
MTKEGSDMPADIIISAIATSAIKIADKYIADALQKKMLKHHISELQKAIVQRDEIIRDLNRHIKKNCPINHRQDKTDPVEHTKGGSE